MSTINTPVGGAGYKAGQPGAAQLESPAAGHRPGTPSLLNQPLPEGLTVNPQAKAKPLPPRGKAALPFSREITQQIGGLLDTKSLVSAAASSHTMRDMLQHPLAVRPQQLMLQAQQAGSKAEFMACCDEIAALPLGHRAGPWAAVAERLAAVHADLPDADALHVRDTLVDGLERLPADPKSAALLERPVLAAFDATQSIAHRALQPGTINWDTYGAVGTAQQRLHGVIKKHGLHESPGFMTRFTAHAFGPKCCPADTMFALSALPKRMDDLEPGDANRGLVRQVLEALALHAVGPNGIAKLPQGQGWGEYARDLIQPVLSKHGINPAAALELGSAMALLPTFS